MITTYPVQGKTVEPAVRLRATEVTPRQKRVSYSRILVLFTQALAVTMGFKV